jgi:hypothetical protein
MHRPLVLLALVEHADTDATTDTGAPGGTGRYANARGSMKLHARPGGTSYDFVFHNR